MPCYTAYKYQKCSYIHIKYLRFYRLAILVVHRYCKVTAVLLAVQMFMITATPSSSNAIHYFQVILQLYKSCCSTMNWKYVIHLVHLQKYIHWVSKVDYKIILFNANSGMFYYQLLNLSPQYRSTLQSIHIIINQTNVMYIKTCVTWSLKFHKYM